ncbi:histone acetyltransferase GCN5 isoform X2 [Tanacetum coccineum]
MGLLSAPTAPVISVYSSQALCRLMERSSWTLDIDFQYRLEDDHVYLLLQFLKERNYPNALHCARSTWLRSTVNAIAPWFISTDLSAQLGKEKKKMLVETPLGYNGTDESFKTTCMKCGWAYSFLTYADNNAGWTSFLALLTHSYSKKVDIPVQLVCFLASRLLSSKSGFTKDIFLEKERWHGYIKDYDGGILMESKSDPKLPYIDLSTMIHRQRQVRAMYYGACLYVFYSLRSDLFFNSFYLKESGIPKRVCKLKDIPGLNIGASIEISDTKSSYGDRVATNKDIVAQVSSATIAGDFVLTSAYAHDWRYLMYRSLLARRALKKLEMDEEYQGSVMASGEDFSVEPIESRRPFRALLDNGRLNDDDDAIDVPHEDAQAILGDNNDPFTSISMSKDFVDKNIAANDAY